MIERLWKGSCRVTRSRAMGILAVVKSGRMRIGERRRRRPRRRRRRRTSRCYRHWVTPLFIFVLTPIALTYYHAREWQGTFTEEVTCTIFNIGSTEPVIITTSVAGRWLLTRPKNHHHRRRRSEEKECGMNSATRSCELIFWKRKKEERPTVE